jgi:uncharacterized Zn finger protein (UPF0148 family)
VSADQLLSIYRYAEQLAADEPELRRQSCPNDGTPYRTGPDGELYCPFDSYRPTEF